MFFQRTRTRTYLRSIGRRSSRLEPLEPRTLLANLYFDSTDGSAALDSFQSQAVQAATETEAAASGVILEDWSDFRINADLGEPLFKTYPYPTAAQTMTLIPEGMRVTVNSGGDLYWHFHPYEYVYPEGFAQGRIEQGQTWNSSINRMTFWVRPSHDYTSDGENAFSVGNYVKPTTDSNESNQGSHYYWLIGGSTFYADRWTKIVLTPKVQASNFQSGSTEYPINPNFFSELTRFYFGDPQPKDIPNGATWDFSPIVFDTVSGEPDNLVASIVATYSGSRYEVAWSGPKNVAQAYQIAYKTTSMKTTGGFDSGTISPTQVTTPDNDYTRVRWNSPAMAEADDLYIAIRPVGQTAFTEIHLPKRTSPSPPDTTPPSTPSNLTASVASGTQIDLSWSAASDPESGIREYRIYRDGQQIAQSSTTSYADASVQPSTSYLYEVSAVNGVGLEGARSAPRSVATPANTTPADTTPQTLVSATALGSSQVAVTFSEPVDEATAEAPNNYSLGPSGSILAAVLLADGKTVSLTTSTLASGTLYTLTVNGILDLAPTANVIAPNSQIQFTLSAPELVAAYGFNQGTGTTLVDSSGNGLNGTISGAAWSASGKYGGALNFDGVNDWVSIADANDLDLTTGMTLEAWVRPTAVNGWETVLLKERSGGLAYSLYGGSPGGPPAGYITPTGTSANVGADGPSALPLNTWSHVATTYDCATIRLYVGGNLVRSTSAAGSIVQSSLPLRIGGNAVWGEYFAGLIDEVRIYDWALTQTQIQSDMSLAVQSPTPDTTPPSTPSGLTTTVASGTQINLSWTAASDAQSGIQKYRVYRGGQLIGEPTSTTFSDTTVQPATSYSYQVSAVNGADLEGSQSTQVTATTPDVTPPSTPSGLTATAASGTQINLSWTAASDAQSGIQKYRVYRGGQLIGEPTSTTFSDTTVQPGTSYSYQVSAVNGQGVEGSKSSSVTATTPVVIVGPSTPTDVTATVNTRRYTDRTRIDVSWTAASDPQSGIQYYRVYRDGRLIGESTDTSYSDTSILPATTYVYEVSAVNGTGVEGSKSSPVTVTTPDEKTGRRKRPG